MVEIDSLIISEIKTSLSSISPFDEKEAEDILFTKKWINSGVGIFRTAKPATPDPHLVAYFLLYDAKAQQLLLVDHKKAELWLPTGGHVEPHEHPKDTVKREILEELSIEAEFLLEDPFFVTVTKTVGQTAGHTDVTLWYLLKGSYGKKYDFDLGEFHQIKWFSFVELPYERSDPQMSRCAKKLHSLNLLY